MEMENVTGGGLYFEKQYGALCGQHCLNNALQANYFTEVDLATFGSELDEEEREMLAMDGEDSPEYISFLQKPSANYDDTGYFSLQVLQRALQNMDMSMNPFFTAAGEEEKDAVDQRLFIVNMDNHWFSLRKFRKVWFELNSLSKSPKPVSDTYLAMYLATLKNEKHSVFLVTGDIPISNGDCWLAYDTPYITDTPITIPTTTKLGGSTVREGEEGLTKQQIVRLRREEFLKTLEKKNNEGSGGAGTSGSSAGPSAKGSNSLAK